VSLREIASLFSELPAVMAPGTALSRIIAFHERKTDILARLAAEQPDDTERAELAAESAEYLTFLHALRDTGVSYRVLGGWA
jgi:hypothetical protein